jgi:uncharacterized membrane protein (UPF0136 family)
MSKPTGSSHAAFAVGGVVIVGGIYALVKKKSLPSLIGSAILGGTIVLGGYYVNQGEAYMGHSISAAASILLCGVGVWRYSVTKKPMPAIPIIIIGSVSSAYQIQKALLFA